MNKKNIILALFVLTLISLMAFWAYGTRLESSSLDMSNTSLTSRSIKSFQNLSGTITNVSVVIVANGTYANQVVNVTFQWRNGRNRVILNMTTITNVTGGCCAGPNRTYFVNTSLDTTILADGFNYNVTVTAYNVTGAFAGFDIDYTTNVGAALSWGIANITIDNTAPTVSSLSPSNGTEYKFVFNSNFVSTTLGLSSNQSFNASVTDATAGVANVTIFFSNGTADYRGSAGVAFNRTATNASSGIWMTTEENVSQLKAGTTTVRFFTRDYANNEDRGQVLTITVNTPHNVTGIDIGGDSCTQQNFSAINTTMVFNVSVQNASLPLNAKTGTSISRVIFAFNNASGTDFNLSAPVYPNLTILPSHYFVVEYNVSNLAEGSNTVTFYVNDTWGNINTTETCSFTVDKTNPTVSVDCGGPYDEAGDDVTCTCTGSDSGSGVKSTRFADSGTNTALYQADDGGTSAVCTVVDHAGNIVTATGTWVYSPSTGGSSGGGGGGSGGGSGGASSCFPNPGKKNIWSEINPGDRPEFVVNDPDNAVSKVKFHVNKKGKGMWMQIKKGECGCGDFTQMPTKTYKCMEITRAKILPDADIGTSTVEFKVANSWFVSNGVARNGVALFRYTGTWEELSTSLGIDDGAFTHYTADTPGFSMFAIGVRPSSVQVQQETTQDAVAPQEVNQDVPSDQGALVGGAIETTGRSTKRAMWPWLALLGIIAIVVIIITTSKHKK